jgi:diguanylate cyclase (GGDEF)-like protein
MKSNNQIIDKITDIGEDSFNRLRELCIPPYPKYYHDAFMETLLASEEPSLIELPKKHSHLFSLLPDEELKEISFDLAKASLNEFEKSNLTLKTISDENIIDISSIKRDYERIHAKEILDAFDSFQTRIISELKNADETITRLKLEIERLERESHIDPLTKSYNRRVFVKDLEEIINTENKKDLDVFVIMFDADDFKNINDSFGHIAGDKTLIYLAKLLQNALKRNTKIYRYGGEEFIIILQKVSLEEIEETVMKILKNADESKLLYKGNHIHLTLSAGISRYTENDTLESLLDRADKALYNAKQSGKNCYKVNI